MVEFFVVAYPWDLPAENVGGALDQLHGGVGFSGLSLWAGIPHTIHLRAVHRNPRTFRTRGGLFFQPAERLYAQTRCQPIVSSWLATGDPLAHLSRACKERDLKLRVMVSAAVGQMAERYPEFSCRNAFGDESYTRLCPANPEVENYLLAMAMDLSSNERVSAICLSDWDIRWPDVDELPASNGLGPVERSLLSVCFCPSCNRRSQSAGIDVEAAQRSVQETVDQSLDRGPAEETLFDKGMTSQPGSLSDHRRTQIEALNALLRRMREACRCELILVRGTDDVPNKGAGELDLSIPSAVITQMDDAGELPSVLPAVGKRNELQLPARWAVGIESSRLVQVLPEAVRAGFTAVGIDHYGLLTDSSLTTLKQAIRFARRSGGDDAGPQPT